MTVATMSAAWTHGQLKLDLHVVDVQCMLWTCSACSSSMSQWSKQLKAILKGCVDNNCMQAAKQERR